MTALAWLVPLALLMGGVGLAAFLWSLKSGQYEDMEGAAYRALEDEPPLRASAADPRKSLSIRRSRCLRTGARIAGAACGKRCCTPAAQGLGRLA